MYTLLFRNIDEELASWANALRILLICFDILGTWIYISCAGYGK